MNNSAEKEALLISGEKQLKKFGSFLENHRKLVKSINYKFEENYNNYNYDIDKLSLEYTNPITLTINSRQENLSYFQLIETDNKILNKILIVFGKLCSEIKSLSRKFLLFQKNVLFYDEDLVIDDVSEARETNNNNPEEDHFLNNVVKLSKILDFLYELKNFLERCLIVGHNIMKQLGALFEYEKYFINIQSSVHFQSVFNTFAELILIFVTFDEILPNSNIAKYWTTYKKTVRSYQQNIEKFNNKYDQVHLNGLQVVLKEIEEIFNGKLIQNAIELFSTIKNEISAKSFATFTTHFQTYLKLTINEIGKYANDLAEYNETETVIKLNSMSIIYHHIFGNLDQKILKNIIEINSKYCSITLAGNIIWNPGQFIRKHSETLIKGYEKSINEASKIQQTYLNNKIQSLTKDTHNYCIQITSWIIHFSDSIKLGCHDMTMEQLRSRCTLILQGVQYSGQISHLIKSITNLHAHLKCKMQKSILMSICKLIEFLKLIILTFQKNINYIVGTVLCIIQHLQYQALFIVGTTKKKISHDSSSTYSERNLDILSAIQIIEKCLFGPATQQRLIIIRLALSLSDPSHTFSVDYLQKLEKILIRLDGIINVQENLKMIAEPTFLYWHQSLLPIYLKQVMEQNIDLSKITYILHSTNECHNLQKELNSNKFQCLELLNETLNSDLKTEVIQKICNQVETSLRLDFHSNLQVTATDPFKTTNFDYQNIIKLQPIQLMNKHIIIKDHIEHYLSNMFYNLTTVSLHDWKTYGEMRQLAKVKFDLETVEDHLPTQTLEQGLDVLEIMRNIHVFVSTYLYNLNNQIFIEQSSNNKHLNTINIRHIANSLRTHGTGIINTTVNFTYQFLRKKFFTFSQFMFDEHIKSRLIKDLKYFRENKEKQQFNHFYSYERADAFNKGIKKLGLSEKGLSYLDLFRLLISHIGNAMGYVRMIRSGGLHSCSNASVYLPVIDDSLVNFKQLCNESQLSEETCMAAENLEFDIKNLSKNYTEGTDYFKLLVDAFAPFFRNPKNSHLKNFYLIVPPLTINFIDHILTSKDKMTKKNKEGALFTDDGFAMGLAYILKLLDQTSDFNSLHWFKSIHQKYNMEHQQLMKQKEQLGATVDEKLQQTLLLTEKRICKVQQEYDLLYFNLSSAKIFFK